MFLQLLTQHICSTTGLASPSMGFTAGEEGFSPWVPYVYHLYLGFCPSVPLHVAYIVKNRRHPMVLSPLTFLEPLQWWVHTF